MSEANTNCWHLDVLADLAAALRRDGLSQTAELMDDAMAVLMIETMSLPRRRNHHPVETCASRLRVVGER